MHAYDVDDVLDILDVMVADATVAADRRGYFAALYRQVTVEVRRGIAAGVFDDGARMSVFDAAFANRYFDACVAPVPPRSWRVAFAAAESESPIVLPHLLLGINAHINLDLGVVTGTMFRGGALAGFRDDFDRINDILAGLIPRTRQVVAGFSP